jgi:hypothetical protein
MRLCALGSQLHCPVRFPRHIDAQALKTVLAFCQCNSEVQLATSMHACGAQFGSPARD